MAIISSFTVEDPSFNRFQKETEPAEENTFFEKTTGRHWQFLEKEELQKYFAEASFDTLFYEEKTIKDQPHPGMPFSHQHGIVRIVAKHQVGFQ